MVAENEKGKYVHIPVMLGEVLHFLQPAPGEIIIDATLGGGGHAEAILKCLLPGGKLIGIDRDRDAIKASQERLSHFGGAFQPVEANFINMAKVIKQLGLDGIDGLLFDLGVSSYQLESEGRGFSYREDVFLDMRMDQKLPQTAAGLLKALSERQLAIILRKYGEEKWAERIASFIIKYRLKKGAVTHSKQLVDIIKDAVPASARRRGGHPAKRVFQALRIAVNRELDHLENGLSQGIEVLRPGGRIVVISYHSLEDRIVKNQFRKAAQKCVCPPGLPVCRCGNVPVIKILTKNPLYPEEEEVIKNSRARSARLRSAEKLDMIS
jgi:16S rRNA (cytosine1402-N4)-methyltransferase